MSGTRGASFRAPRIFSPHCHSGDGRPEGRPSQSAPRTTPLLALHRGWEGGRRIGAEPGHGPHPPLRLLPPVGIEPVVAAGGAEAGVRNAPDAQLLQLEPVGPDQVEAPPLEDLLRFVPPLPEGKPDLLADLVATTPDAGAEGDVDVLRVRARQPEKARRRPWRSRPCRCRASRRAPVPGLSAAGPRPPRRGNPPSGSPRTSRGRSESRRPPKDGRRRKPALPYPPPAPRLHAPVPIESASGPVSRVP